MIHGVSHERVLRAKLGLTRLNVAVDKFDVAFTMARLYLLRESEQDYFFLLKIGDLEVADSMLWVSKEHLK